MQNSLEVLIMAGTIKQLKENINFIQSQLKGLSRKERDEVFRCDDKQFKEFINSLNDVYKFISKLDKDGHLPKDKGNLVEFKDSTSDLINRLFREERLSLHSPYDIQTENGKRLNSAIKNLTQEIDDFNHALGIRSDYKFVESGMRGLNNRREKRILEHSSELQKIMLNSRLSDVAEQKKDIDQMTKLLNSTKSIFIKNSPYFDALENSLKALKEFTDKLPQGQQQLNEAQTEKLTELYNNAYKAADSYINRKENYAVRGNRMNMARQLRETLRVGAGAHLGLEKNKAEAAKKAAEKRAAILKKVKVSLNELNKDPGKDKAPSRRNSIAEKSKSPLSNDAPITRQRTLGG